MHKQNSWDENFYLFMFTAYDCTLQIVVTTPQTIIRFTRMHGTYTRYGSSEYVAHVYFEEKKLNTVVDVDKCLKHTNVS